MLHTFFMLTVYDITEDKMINAMLILWKASLSKAIIFKVIYPIMPIFDK